MTKPKKYRKVVKKGTVDTMKKMSSAAYLRDSKKIAKKMAGTGYKLDTSISTREHKVFLNPKTKKAVVAYRGTVPTRMKDIKSDLAILTGREKKDKRFKDSVKVMDRVKKRYPGYKFGTTGHSLGGQLATHVTRKRSKDVKRNISFSRGAGLKEPFRKRPKQTLDVSHKSDIISLGARLSRGKKGSNIVDKSKRSHALDAHDLEKLQVVS